MIASTPASTWRGRGPASAGALWGRGPAADALAALAATLAALAPRRPPAVETLLRFAFRAWDLLAGRLIDDFHRQAHLAAIIEAQQLDVDFLTFLDDLGDGFGTPLGQLRD